MGAIQKSDLCQGLFSLSSFHNKDELKRVHQIFNVSHMAPYDAPHVAHDMMLRFMNVNFSAIVDGSARIPSKVGNQEKPSFVEETDDGAGALIPVPAGKTPEQDKAMWEGQLLVFLCHWALMIEAYYSLLQRRVCGFGARTHCSGNWNISALS